MDKNTRKILKEAQSLLERLENGKTYPSEYVISRFQKAANDFSTDQLIGNMRDVLVKVSSNRQYIHQKEIGKLYDEMYGLANGHTAFRDVLGDLLPEDRQFAKVAHSGSNLRKMEELNVEPIYKDSNLSNAFSVLFSMGGDSAFGTYKPAEDRSIQKTLTNKLTKMGHNVLGVDIIQSNEHFTLCSANFQDSNLNKVSALIPVQTTDGVVKEPEFLVLGEKVVNLDSRNLFMCLKEQERSLKNKNQQKFASERGDGSPSIEIEKKVVPNSLKQFADLENALIVAASKFSQKQIISASQVLNQELKGMNIPGFNIKVAGSDEKSILFDVFIPTKLGSVVIHVPIEFQNKTVLMPNKFATNQGASDHKIYDFSKRGFSNFMSNLTSTSDTLNIARQTGNLSKMSYQELMDRMIEGVATKDYRMSEDVLQTIENRFGSEKFLTAFDQFSNLLKHSSTGETRKNLIKEAFNRGELIEVPTSVELYCPKLGLPVSKISFDDNGKIIPKGRRAKSENQIQGTQISTSKIILT